jgi:3-oxoacyl-[acyl-carrier-protein] synthase II
MASRRNVVVTGMGVASPLGCTAGGFWDGLLTGRAGIGPVTRFDPARFACRLAGEVDDGRLDPVDGPFSFEIKRMSTFVRHALHAAGRAIGDSRLFPDGRPPPGGAVFMGVAMGGLPSIEAGVLRQERHGVRKTTPFLIPSLIPNMAASMIALRHAITAPQRTVAGACASGSQAIGEAAEAIRSGACDWALAGGAEAVTTPITWSGFEAMHALSPGEDAGRAPRPFDRGRDGMICGEGAAVFVLEERSRAEARGAAILGAVGGYATNSGCGEDITGIAVADTAACMAAALDDAGLAPSEIGCVFAQASGMVRGDAAELAAVRATFGPARLPAVTSIKGHTGYLFAANGPVNVAAALLAMRDRLVPPTRNLDAPDPEFGEFDIPTAARRAEPRHCLVNAFGFGGINATLVVSRPDLS